MHVAMVDVGVVGMRVRQNVVTVGMAVRFAGRILRSMPVLMVCVVRVQVVVLDRLMDMFMLVTFGQMQPNSRCHESNGGKKTECRQFAQEWE